MKYLITLSLLLFFIVFSILFTSDYYGEVGEISEKVTEVSNLISCNYDIQKKLDEVDYINNQKSILTKKEKDLLGFATEGAKIIYYYENKNLKLIETYSFVSLARFIDRFYISDNNTLFFVESISEEWDLEKLHGKNGELSSSEGQYVVATSSKEGYLVDNDKLCNYIPIRPRKASVAVSESEPLKDFQSLNETYKNTLLKNK
jgi:hypothetical protein